MFKDCRDDLGHAALLENPLVTPMSQVGQARCQRQAIPGESAPGVIAADRVNLPVQPLCPFAKIEIGGLMKQCFQVQAGVLTEHLHLNEKRLIDDLVAFKRKHLKVCLYSWNDKVET